MSLRSCLSGIAKYILFVFNFLLIVCAIILIGFGIIALINNNKGIEDITEFSVGGFAIAVGIIIFFVAFLGCYGAMKENSCMLTTYAIVLIILFIIQIVLGVLTLVSAKNDDNELGKKTTDEVKKLFDKYGTDKDSRKLIDDCQQNFECCGVEGPSYWGNNLPSSCCESERVCSLPFAYTKGCSKAVTDFIEKTYKVIGGVAIAFAIFEILGAVLAYLIRNR